MVIPAIPNPDVAMYNDQVEIGSKDANQGFDNIHKQENYESKNLDK